MRDRQRGTWQDVCRNSEEGLVGRCPSNLYSPNAREPVCSLGACQVQGAAFSTHAHSKPRSTFLLALQTPKKRKRKKQKKKKRRRGEERKKENKKGEKEKRNEKKENTKKKGEKKREKRKMGRRRKKKNQEEN